MLRRLSVTRRVTLLFALLLLAAGSAGAQDRLRNFTYDSVFHIGGHAVGLPRLAKDSLRLDFTYTYGVDLMRLPYILGGSLNPNVWDTNHAYEYWHDTLERNFYRDADDAEFGLIFNPGRWHWQKAAEGGAEVGSINTCDNYARCDSMQFMDFMQRDTAAAFKDVGPERRVFTMTVSSSSNDSDRAHLMVGSPRYVTTSAYWIGNRGVYTQLALQRGLHGTDSLALLDSAHFMRFSFSFRADSLTEMWWIDDTAEIASIVMYRPFDTSLAGCQCHINDAFMRVPITAEMVRKPELLPRDTLFHEPLRTLSFWLDMRGGHIDTNYAIDSGYTHHQAHLDHRVPAPGTDSACLAQSAVLLQNLIAGGRIGAGSDTDLPVEGSEIHFRFYTTRRAPVTFLRSRASMHQFEMLASGGMDDWLRQEIDTLWKSPALDCVRRRILHLGYFDEPDNPTFAAMPLLSRKIQQFTNADTPEYKATLFANPVCNWDGYRVFTGDCDTASGLKPIHLMARQEYRYGPNGMIPVRYANPDYMDDTALVTFYPDSGANRIIAFSTMSDYHSYTQSIQEAAFGKIGDRDVPEVTSVKGPMVPYLARGVDVGRFKYRQLTRDSMPVWNVVRVAGWFDPAPTVNGLRIAGNRWGLRPCTPEEITGSCWLSLNAGSSGILYQDLIWDGKNFGVYDKIYGVGRIDRALPFDSLGNGEYDRTSNPNPDKINDPWYLTPKIWLGFRTRFDAIRRINAALRDTILPVYEKLAFAQEQMSVHDTTVSFATFPMLDTVQARRCWRYELENGIFKDTTTYDPRDSTYLEVTHFRPGLRDSLGRAQHARYLLFSNRRTWPIDTLVYSARTTRYNPGSARGLGYFDVRRPVIRLKNSTDIMADSAIVEKIGDTSWHRTVRFGVALDLDWLEPGWGAMYRVIPIPAPVSLHGTAFNNSVRSENSSQRTTRRDRMYVYERDSIVYLRCLDSAGRWGREFALSDSADRAHQGGAGWNPAAANARPALAAARNGTAAVVVWERMDLSASTVTIEALVLEPSPSASDSVLPDTMRFRVSQPRPTFSGGAPMAPSIVGVNGGYFIAWPSADSGISLTLLRNRLYGSAHPQHMDTVSAHHIWWNGAVAPVISRRAFFPTLASRAEQRRIFTDPDHWTAYVGTEPGDTLRAIDTTGVTAHLAYQQGDPASATGQHIMYNTIAGKIRSTLSPVIWVAPTEHVSAAVPGCAWLHPSIAADSLRLGVAFQGQGYLSTRVILRFRDTASPAPNRAWAGPTYNWYRGTVGWDEWPSLTQFPALPLARLRETSDEYSGALAWYRCPASSGHTDLLLYRYGAGAAERIGIGQYPTMTLVSRLDSGALPASGILYRGDSTLGFEGTRPAGTTGVYYPAAAINASVPSSLFTAAKAGTLLSGVDLRQSPADLWMCSRWQSRDADIRVGVWQPETLMVTGYPRANPGSPGLPSAFFAEPGSESDRIDAADDVERLALTGPFQAGATSVYVGRHVSRSSYVQGWLDTSPFDSLLGIPADVLILTELVRSSDSAVLWHDDTISVRAMSTDTLDELVEVPVGTAASPGTTVFVRLRAIETQGLEAEHCGFFDWVIDEESLMPKLVMQRQRSVKAGARAGLEVGTYPNPSNRQTRLRIHAAASGMLELSIHGPTGERVAGVTEMIDVAGEYGLTLNTDLLTPGVYIVTVRLSGQSARTRMVVVR